MSDQDVDIFWRWFSGVAARLAADVTRQDLLAELDRRLHDLNPDLGWEIGPGSTASWALTISPNMNPSFEFDSESRSIQIDASNWKYLLLRYEDGTAEILVYSGAIVPKMNEGERMQAARIVLESELGEKVLMDPKLTYDLVEELDAELQNKLRPIQQIRQAFGSSELTEVPLPSSPAA